jgi:hypothetical protein
MALLLDDALSVPVTGLDRLTIVFDAAICQAFAERREAVRQVGRAPTNPSADDIQVQTLIDSFYSFSARLMETMELLSG